MEMATVCAPTLMHHYKHSSRFSFTTINTNPPSPLIFSPLRHRLPSLNLSTNPNARLSRCHSASPVPPSPPDPNPSRPPGLAGTFSSFQNHVRIFFAVLFWMSLFFWASAWDGRNNNRPRKGSPFRR